jgi:hypothetical protein
MLFPLNIKMDDIPDESAVTKLPVEVNFSVPAFGMYAELNVAAAPTAVALATRLVAPAPATTYLFVDEPVATCSRKFPYGFCGSEAPQICLPDEFGRVAMKCRVLVYVLPVPQLVRFADHAAAVCGL